MRSRRGLTSAVLLVCSAYPHGLAVTELLRTLAKQYGHTVVVVTHDSRIFHLADRIVHIEDGLIQRVTEKSA